MYAVWALHRLWSWLPVVHYLVDFPLAISACATCPVLHRERVWDVGMGMWVVSSDLSDLEHSGFTFWDDSYIINAY